MTFEPNEEEALSLLIPKYITSILYGVFVEAVASENGARMQAMDSATNNAEEIIIVAMFAAMVAVIFFQVIMRYIFNNSLPWSEELGKFFFVWISWLGISLGARYGEHIKITMLVDRLPFRAAQVLNILSEIIVIGICVVTLYYGVSLVMSQMATHYSGIKISVSWGYLAVVLGCGLMTIRSIISTIKSYHNWRNEEVDIRVLQDVVPRPCEDYTYIFHNGEWHCIENYINLFGE